MLERIGFGGLGIMLAVLFWVVEAVLHAFVFGSHHSFSEAILGGDANENWMRVLISITMIGFGFYAQRAVERQEALQLALRKKGERLQEIIDRSYDAYVSCDCDGVITDWNRSAELLFGWPRHRILGQPLQVLLPERLRDDHQRGMEHYKQSNIGPWLYKPVRTQGLHRDGFEFSIEMVVTPLNCEGHIEFFAFIREQTS